MNTEQFEARLREHGYRLTAQRREVWEAVERLRHATPEQIAAELPGVDTSTIYRALEVLIEVGLISHTHIGHGPPVYHAVDTVPHLHLVCQRCGAQITASVTLTQSLQASLTDEYGFVADLDYLSLPGLCRACREESAGPSTL